MRENASESDMAAMKDLADEVQSADTPAQRLTELAADVPFEVAVLLVGQPALTEEGLELLVGRFPRLRRAAAEHWNAPFRWMEEVPINNHGNSVLQAYMNRIGADEDLWARVHAAREAAPIPGGQPLGTITRKFREHHQENDESRGE